MKETFHEHQPVMLTEVLANLAIQPNGVYIDATFGRGGHAEAILNQLGMQGRLLAMDKDPTALAFAQQRFATDSRFKIQQGTFADIAHFAKEQNVLGKVNGILFDLGVSSPQLDNPLRGFSFQQDAPLDMRMDNSQGIDAATWIAKVSEPELAQVFWEYGEERYSRRIARAIVAERQLQPITTTKRLAEVIAKAHPAWQKGKHPATQCFQAIRIVINNELNDLEQGLKQSLTLLAKGGRLLVISFHSLEDRMVKQFMQHEERGNPLPAGLPIKHQDRILHFKRLSRAIKPTAREIAINSRARSAILRIGEKLS